MRIILRTRGNHKQGMGDVIGSIAIAEVLKGRVEIQFIVDNDSEAVESIAQRGYGVKAVRDIKEELDFLDSYQPDAIMVNLLNSTKDFLTELKKRAGILATIDDSGSGSAVADLRFNPLYNIPDSYCSPEFVPLRKEFQDTHKKEKSIDKKVKKVLVTMGGSDTYGFTPKVVRALAGIRGEVEIKVVVGPAFRHDKELDEAIRKTGRQFLVRRNITAMAELMFSSDMAVCTAGLTLFELACTGIPSVVVCAELFEEETASRLQENGFGINLGFGEKVEESSIFQAVNSLMENYKLRYEMSTRGKMLVDGGGARRMAEVILKKVEEKTNV